ncbi:MAG: hypothetical protein IT451_10655 [Candidatus Brocadia sp.]|nr:hypothetical protein [Candidatus Brocadia sp.]
MFFKECAIGIFCRWHQLKQVIKVNKSFWLLVLADKALQRIFIEIGLLCIVGEIGKLNIQIIPLYSYRFTIAETKPSLFSLLLFDIVFFLRGIDKLKMYPLLTGKLEDIVTQIFR